MSLCFKRLVHPIFWCNVLQDKYLNGHNTRSSVWSKPTEINDNDTLGNMGYSFVAVGVYFCSSIGQFGCSEDGIVDPLVDATGRQWRLVTSEYVDWMAGMIRKAFENEAVPYEDLGAAILKFYRVRDRLDAEMAAVAESFGGGQHRPGGPGVAKLTEGKSC